jgi:hypothetical protein
MTSVRRLAALLTLALAGAAPPSAYAQRLDGFNVIMVQQHPFGSESAKRSLVNAKRTGAAAVAIVPFLWQAAPAAPSVNRGTDMSDQTLRSAIRDAHSLGLAAVLKPHVWVPTRWAGSIEPATEDDWQTWFANYGREIEALARIATEEKAEAFAIGTELLKTTRRPEWIQLIKKVRIAYSGTLFYVAHNVEEAEAVSFWNLLDAIGVSLYPPLGADDDRDGRLATMRAVAQRLDRLAARFDKPIFVSEVGLRSATGAAAKPWESAEERVAPADPQLQADVLADWLAVLDSPAIRGVLIWRWLTDPAAGGATDTDFTVQGKPAERILRCAWSAGCAQ